MESHEVRWKKVKADYPIFNFENLKQLINTQDFQTLEYVISNDELIEIYFHICVASVNNSDLSYYPKCRQMIEETARVRGLDIINFREKVEVYVRLM